MSAHALVASRLVLMPTIASLLSSVIICIKLSYLEELPEIRTFIIFFNIGCYGWLRAHEAKLLVQNKKIKQRFILHQRICECTVFFTLVTMFATRKVKNSYDLYLKTGISRYPKIWRRPKQEFHDVTLGLSVRFQFLAYFPF